jgi:hypothetical protein
MTTKPCILCRIECDILPVQLGDFFTLTYLRVCGAECMFLVAYDYLYEIGEHKSFRNSLHDKENDEDKAECKRFRDEVTKQALESMRKDLENSINLLSTPIPPLIHEMFSNSTPLPQTGGTMKFTRPSKKDKISWQAKHVVGLRERLAEAEKDLEALINE